MSIYRMPLLSEYSTSNGSSDIGDGLRLKLPAGERPGWILRDQDESFCAYANPTATAVMGPQADRQLRAANLQLPQVRSNK
ncbi:hypothetical protein [Rhizobium leguminosarum]|uniref:hypothetical protein n=1 Tax=Rhizobium leguminosarum TaxID=384 RepID=UPI003D04441A